MKHEYYRCGKLSLTFSISKRGNYHYIKIYAKHRMTEYRSRYSIIGPHTIGELRQKAMWEFIKNYPQLGQLTDFDGDFFILDRVI